MATNRAKRFVKSRVTPVKINPHTPKEDLTTHPFSLLYVPALPKKTGSRVCQPNRVNSFMSQN